MYSTFHIFYKLRRLTMTSTVLFGLCLVRCMLHCRLRNQFTIIVIYYGINMMLYPPTYCWRLPRKDSNHSAYFILQRNSLERKNMRPWMAFDNNYIKGNHNLEDIRRNARYWSDVTSKDVFSAYKQMLRIFVLILNEVRSCNMFVNPI